MSARRRVPASRRAQAGVTLISMMVGLVISLITIAAMLAVYQAASGVSTAATTTTQREGQLASALLGAQIELQQAGFGLDAGVDGLELSPSELVWRHRRDLDGPLFCAGLRIGQVDGDGATALFLLDEQACDGALQAGAARPLAVLSAAVAGDAALDAGHIDLQALRFEHSDDSGCLPYEQHRDSAHALPGAGEIFSVCLPNLGKRVRLVRGDA